MHSSFSIGTKFFLLYKHSYEEEQFCHQKVQDIFTPQKNKILERFEDVPLNDLDLSG